MLLRMSPGGLCEQTNSGNSCNRGRIGIRRVVVDDSTSVAGCQETAASARAGHCHFRQHASRIGRRGDSVTTGRRPCDSEAHLRGSGGPSPYRAWAYRRRSVGTGTAAWASRGVRHSAGGRLLASAAAPAGATGAGLADREASRRRFDRRQPAGFQCRVPHPSVVLANARA